MQTLGISPKVLAPTLVLFAVGLLLVVVAALLGDEQLRPIGLSALGAAVTTLIAGYKAPPGDVVPDPGVGEPLDDHHDQAGVSPEVAKEHDLREDVL